MGSGLRGRRWMRVGVALLWIWPLAGGAGQMQQVPPGTPGPPGLKQPQLPGISGDQPIGPNSATMEHMRENDRRKRLLSDTAKLVALSNELNEEVKNTSKDELSLEVVRKAEEIEKLAHDVKERMKG